MEDTEVFRKSAACVFGFAGIAQRLKPRFLLPHGQLKSSATQKLDFFLASSSSISDRINRGLNWAGLGFTGSGY
jgi:hypothetical protein